MSKNAVAVEACNSLGHAMNEACATLAMSKATGLIYAAERKSKRAMWDCTEGAYNPDIARYTHDGFLIEHVAALYSVPPVLEGLPLRPTFSEWHALARKTQITLLSKCVLPV